MTQGLNRSTTVHTEGGLLPRDLLERVAGGRNGLSGLEPGHYHLAPGERLGEAISRSWNRLLGVWTRFQDELYRLPDDEQTATALTRSRWSQVLFQELGYGQLQASRPVEIDDKQYPVSHGWGPVPIHLVGARVDINRSTPGVAGAARMSPHGLVQELLNRSPDRLWGIVSNGVSLRLLRDNAALTRQAFVEFDVEAMFEGQEYADFALLWMVCHQSRVEGEVPEECWLEQWRAEAATHGTRALDQLRASVEAALQSLGEGFIAHPENGRLRGRLESGRLDRQDYYRQLLRLVYRLIFVLVTEHRDVLLDGAPEAKQRYRCHYSIGRLQELAEAHRGGPHGDLWHQLRVVFDGLGAADGIPALALPGQGSFLWSERATPDLDPAYLANSDLLDAIRSLSRVRDGGVLRKVDYRNLGSEELGSVYESLLAFHPEINLAHRTFGLARAAGNDRKTSGSYYTPTPLINELLDSALEPVLDRAARAADPQAAILGLRVLDPACGSGHFLVAAAHRMARRLAIVRSGEPEPAPDDLQKALRDVVAHCLHGIDLNEMAVELCKVTLWLEAVEPGRPLAFLDHRIVHGNALLGTTPRLLDGGVPDDAFKELTGDDPNIVRELKARNKQERKGGQQSLLFGPAAPAVEAVAQAHTEVDTLPDRSMSDIAAKEQRWSDLLASTEYEQVLLAADAWCAAFVAPKRVGQPVITTEFVRQAQENEVGRLDRATVEAVEGLWQQYRFLHLHLTFPEVFSLPRDGEQPDHERMGWNGGFDIVLGNPPWDKVKLQEKEYFATRSPEIADAGKAADRKKQIAKLEVSDDPTERELYREFRAALRRSEGASHYLRHSGRYPLCGTGDVNTYAVFAEAMRDAVSSTGRLGVIVPTGIATDATTKLYFADLVEQRSLVSLFDFENGIPAKGIGNRRHGEQSRWFPGVHGSYKFCLLTITGTGVSVDDAVFSFFAHQVTDLHQDDRRFVLTPEDFQRINPNTRTCPIFRTRRDAELTKAIYRRVPVLIKEGREDGNPWSVDLSTMFHMTNDSGLFRTGDQLEQDGWTLAGNTFHKNGERWLPLYEAKMVSFYDHRAADVVISPTATQRKRQPAYIPASSRTDPLRLSQPLDWVPEAEVQVRLPAETRWLVGWCDITSSTNERTVISTIGPEAGYGNKMPLMLRGSDNVWLLPAILSSFVADFAARQKVGSTTLNFFIVNQLPVPPPEWFEEKAAWDPGVTLAEWIKPRVLELTYTAWDLEAFGQDLGWGGPPFRWDDERRVLLRAELDACFFHVYGIERDDVDYIMGTFPIVQEKDAKAYGEYRTRRLILQAYDAMVEAQHTGSAYQTVLDPAPAHPTVAHPESSRPAWAERPEPRT